MPVEVLEITRHFMRDPVRILVKKDELTLEGIKQFYIAVEREDWKLETLCDLYETLTITQAIISACRPRSYTSPLFLALAVFIHKKYGSRELWVFLQVSRSEPVYINAQLKDNSTPLPESADGIIQFAFDNADINIAAQTGELGLIVLTSNNYQYLKWSQCVHIIVLYAYLIFPFHHRTPRVFTMM